MLYLASLIPGYMLKFHEFGHTIRVQIGTEIIWSTVQALGLVSSTAKSFEHHCLGRTSIHWNTLQLSTQANLLRICLFYNPIQWLEGVVKCKKFYPVMFSNLTHPIRHGLTQRVKTEGEEATYHLPAASQIPSEKWSTADCF